ARTAAGPGTGGRRVAAGGVRGGRDRRPGRAVEARRRAVAAEGPRAPDAADGPGPGLTAGPARWLDGSPLHSRPLGSVACPFPTRTPGPPSLSRTTGNVCWPATGCLATPTAGGTGSR